MDHSFPAATRTLAGFLCLGLAAAPAAAADLVLDKSSNFTVVVNVNGAPLRLRVDPAANGVVVLNPDAVRRAGLKDGPIDRDIARALGLEKSAAGQASAFGSETDIASGGARSRIDAGGTKFGVATQVGSIRTSGKMALAPMSINQSRSSKLFGWFNDKAVDGDDGVIHPAELPFDKVTLQLSAPRAGEKSFSFAGEYRPLGGFLYNHMVRGRPVAVRFSIWEAKSLATAAAGAVIAEANRGSWSGEAREYPVLMGIRRLVRPLGLQKPLSLQGFRLGNFLVRTRDSRGSYQLPIDAPVDPDEIVVVGASKQPARFQLVVGREDLSACSSITYIRRTSRLVLSCLPS